MKIYYCQGPWAYLRRLNFRGCFAVLSRNFREKLCSFSMFFFQISFIIGIYPRKFDKIDKDYILKQQVKNKAKVILMKFSYNFREKQLILANPEKKL